LGESTIGGGGGPGGGHFQTATGLATTIHSAGPPLRAGPGAVAGTAGYKGNLQAAKGEPAPGSLQQYFQPYGDPGASPPRGPRGAWQNVAVRGLDLQNRARGERAGFGTVLPSPGPPGTGRAAGGGGQGQGWQGFFFGRPGGANPSGSGRSVRGPLRGPTGFKRGGAAVTFGVEWFPTRPGVLRPGARAFSAKGASFLAGRERGGPPSRGRAGAGGGRPPLGATPQPFQGGDRSRFPRGERGGRKLRGIP